MKRETIRIAMTTEQQKALMGFWKAKRILGGALLSQPAFSDSTITFGLCNPAETEQISRILQLEQ